MDVVDVAARQLLQMRPEREALHSAVLAQHHQPGRQRQVVRSPAPTGTVTPPARHTCAALPLSRPVSDENWADGCYTDPRRRVDTRSDATDIVRNAAVNPTPASVATCLVNSDTPATVNSTRAI